MDELRTMLANAQSKFYDGPAEGFYFRVDDDNQDGVVPTPDGAQGFLMSRAKIVRHDFLQAATNEDGEVEHWSKAKLVRNIVQYS